jgi:hypothetical protein
MLRAANEISGAPRMTQTAMMMMFRHAARLATTGCVLAMLATTAPANAQSKDLSDSSIKSLMNYAWALMPGPKVTTQDGKEVVIDDTKREEIMIPLDAAREVIKVGRLSANAQTCGLGEEQSSNHATLMQRERAKKKWSEAQMIYINQLHLFTVMLMTGGVKLVENDAAPNKDGTPSKTVVIEGTKITPPKADACNDAERTKLADLLKAYREGK